MKIVDVKTKVLSVPFSKPTRWPYGTWEGVTVVLVEMVTDEGITGVGESHCLQSPAEAFESFIQGSKPLLVGEDPHDIERIMRKLEGLGGWRFAPQFFGYAFGGLDMACWDIVGKAAGVPLYQLWGGALRKTIPFYKFLHHDSPEVMAQEAEEAVVAGYKSLYLKYIDTEHLDRAVHTIWEAVGHKAKLWVDVNGTFSPGFAVQWVKKVEDKIEILEQPCLPTDLDGMRYVRESTSVRILAHESSWTLSDVVAVISRGAADIISVEPKMSGSLLNAKKAAGIAEAAGYPVLLHSVAELGVAQAFFLHLAASTPNFILENQGMYDWFADDYIKGGKMPFHGDSLAVPEGPGIGVMLDPEQVEKYHENYRKGATYSSFGLGSKRKPVDHITLWPSY